MNRFRLTCLLTAMALFSAPAFAGADESYISDKQEKTQLDTTETQAKTSSIKPVTGGIEVERQSDGADRFQIYSITGQLVKTVVLPGLSSERIELPRGCYIVKCSAWSKKIMVR